MKIDFSNKIATVSAELTFDEMAAMQNMLELAAIESDVGDTASVFSIAEKLGIDVDIEACDMAEGNDSSTDGQDLDETDSSHA